jgi:hypothetical protein
MRPCGAACAAAPTLASLNRPRRQRTNAGNCPLCARSGHRDTYSHGSLIALLNNYRIDRDQCANKPSKDKLRDNLVIRMKTIMRLVFAVAVSAAALCFNVPVSLAFEHGPWCAVVNIGTGNVIWDCQYNSIEECVPHVLSGNRGFCNVNPAFGLYAAQPTKHRKHRKRY